MRKRDWKILHKNKGLRKDLVQGLKHATFQSVPPRVGSDVVAKQQKTELEDKLERQLVRMACAKANDAVKLAFLENEDRDVIDKLDLNALAEFKRGSNGVVEVKFTDRMGIIAALMERCQEDPTEALLRQLGGMTDE